MLPQWENPFGKNRDMGNSVDFFFLSGGCVACCCSVDIPHQSRKGAGYYYRDATGCFYTAAGHQLQEPTSNFGDNSSMSDAAGREGNKNLTTVVLLSPLGPDRTYFVLASFNDQQIPKRHCKKRTLVGRL